MSKTVHMSEATKCHDQMSLPTDQAWNQKKVPVGTYERRIILDVRVIRMKLNE
jgi:hypothetical protein